MLPYACSYLQKDMVVHCTSKPLEMFIFCYAITILTIISIF